jgi:hypothetical protein
LLLHNRDYSIKNNIKDKKIKKIKNKKNLLFGSSKTKKKKTLRRYVLIHAAALIALNISLLVHS